MKKSLSVFDLMVVVLFYLKISNSVQMSWWAVLLPYIGAIVLDAIRVIDAFFGLSNRFISWAVMFKTRTIIDRRTKKIKKDIEKERGAK